VSATLKIEAEKGFRRTLFEPELVDPNTEINFDKDSERTDHPGSETPLSHTVEREIV
jgi:hypothetical protein